MTRKTLLALALVTSSLVPAGCQGTVDTPIGPFDWDFTTLPKAYADLEVALGNALDHYVEAVLSGDAATADAWEELIELALQLKECCSRDSAPGVVLAP